MLRWATATAWSSLQRGHIAQRGLLGHDVPDLFRLLHRGYKKQANEVVLLYCTSTPHISHLQIRAGNVLQLHGKLFQVVKAAYTQGAGRQLGNVTVRSPAIRVCV